MGGKGEGFTPHLMVVLARREVDGVGLSAVRGGARVRWPPVRGFWWLRVAVLGSLSTTSQRGTRGRGRGRQCGEVEAAPQRAGGGSDSVLQWWCSGGLGRGTGEWVRGMERGGPPGTGAHERREIGDLPPSGPRWRRCGSRRSFGGRVAEPGRTQREG